MEVEAEHGLGLRNDLLDKTFKEIIIEGIQLIRAIEDSLLDL